MLLILIATAVISLAFFTILCKRAQEEYIIDISHLIWHVNVSKDTHCTICYDPVVEPCVFNRYDFPNACLCSKDVNVYCKKCLMEWICKYPQCPVCRINAEIDV